MKIENDAQIPPDQPVTKVHILYRADGVMRTDDLETTGELSTAIVSDGGRGYAYIPGERRLYRRIERIIIEGDQV